jgi:hypothetical protein
MAVLAGLVVAPRLYVQGAVPEFQIRMLQSRLPRMASPFTIGKNPIMRLAMCMRVMVAACLALLFSSMTAYASAFELLEDLARIGEDLAPESETVARLAKAASATEAAKSAFRSLRSAANGAYVARTEDGIVCLTAAGELMGKWSLNDGATVAKFAASRAGLHPEALFELFVESDVFLDPGVALQQLPNNVIVGVVWPDGRISETRLAHIHGKIEHLVEGNDSKTLFIDMRNKEARSKFADLQKRSFSKNDVNLLTLVDPKANRATAEALEGAARENGVRNTIASAQDIESAVRAAHRKLLLVVGHTEGLQFVVRAADNSELYTVGFERLASLAWANDVTLISLGCGTGPGGLLTDVQSLDIAVQLKHAFAAKNYLDFFSALGTPESPFVVTAEQINGSTVLVVRRLDEQKKLARAGIGTATTLWIGSTPILTPPIVGLLSIAGGGILFIFLAGLGLSLAMLSAKPLKWAFWVVASPIISVFVLACLLAGFGLSIAIFSVKPAKWGLSPLVSVLAAIRKAREKRGQIRQEEVSV